MLLDQALLDKVSAEAKESPRLRMNFNFYESLDFAGIYGVHIPKGQCHFVEVLESGTVMFEVKEESYAPLSNENIINIISVQ